MSITNNEKIQYVLMGLPLDLVLALIMYASLYVVYPSIKNSSWEPMQKLGIFLAIVFAFMLLYTYFATKVAPELAVKITDKWGAMTEDTRKEAPYVALMMVLVICALFFGAYAFWHPGEWGALATAAVLVALAMWPARHVLH